MENLDPEEKKIFTLIPQGMDRPRPLKEFVQLTGYSSRMVRATIYRLTVLHKKPIGAIRSRPGNGYFIITNDEERAAALAPLTSQIREMVKRAKIIDSADLEHEE